MSVENPVGTVGDVLGIAGVPMTITYEGKQHPVSPPTLRVLDRVEKLVAQRAMAAVNEMADYLSTADYTAQKEALEGLLRTRQHATLGKLWAEEFKTSSGLTLLYWACLEEARDQSPNPKQLPPQIPLDKMSKLLRESPDATMVFMIVVPSFIQAVGEKANLPLSQIEEMTQKVLANLSKPVASPT